MQIKTWNWLKMHLIFFFVVEKFGSTLVWLGKNIQEYKISLMYLAAYWVWHDINGNPKLKLTWDE